MSQDYLGLFDTPYDRREVRFCIAIVVVLAAAALLVAPIRNDELGQADAFVPMVDAFLLIVDLITAALLYAQAAVFRSRALTVLAAGYVFSALLLIPHALSFPGAFAPEGLLGAEVNTTGWLANFRRVAQPITIIAYVLLRRPDARGQSRPERPRPRVIPGVLAAPVLAAGATLLATRGHHLLPAFFIDRAALASTYTLAVEIFVLVLFAVATVTLFRLRRSVLDLWLLVALVSWLIQSALILTLEARFTAGWYALYIMSLTSRLVVMVALLAESHRLYARLALARSVRGRERDARLMSMEAVAAAIAHEVGQPLAAVMLNLQGSLKWLTHPTPNIDMATKSLGAAIASGTDTFDVIKNTRAMFATGPGATSEFDLNELVISTQSRLSSEIAAHKVSLRLVLDETLPPVHANRVQLQRVLVNLFINAMEALEATSNRPRRMVVRTSSLEGGGVLLEVLDNGAGIEAGADERIFEAFFTTKPAGTGLGLSLSRTIVEEHGGRLWATPCEPHGTTFHLQLPVSTLPRAEHDGVGE